MLKAGKALSLTVKVLHLGVYSSWKRAGSKNSTKLLHSVFYIMKGNLRARFIKTI